LFRYILTPPTLAVQKHNWDAKDNVQVSKAVMKDAVTLHKVLSRYLPPEQLQEVFSRTYDMFCRKLPPMFAKVKTKTDAGKRRCVRVGTESYRLWALSLSLTRSLFCVSLFSRITNEIQKVVLDFNKMSNVQIDAKKLTDLVAR
jgi:hypothetical protein